ncbi:MAG: helix-turn-helix domain-containing protein [Acidaminococcaceae bacterium]|nr:helix-turn-helix domain-containing protein [Acidaminococcaceae bacterium]
MQAMADLCGLSKQYISVLEKGVNPNTKKEFIPSIETIKKISDGTGINLTTLIGMLDPDQQIGINNPNPIPNFDNIIPIKKKSFPVIGTIAAGTPIDAEQNIETYVPEDEDMDADYALRVKGDSMIGDDINDGDIVFIRQQPDVEDGEIAAVYVDGGATLKRVFKIGESVQLRSSNSKYKPMNFTAENCEEFKVLGKAVKKLTDIK